MEQLGGKAGIIHSALQTIEAFYTDNTKGQLLEWLICECMPE